MLSTRQIRHLWVASNITVSFYPCIWQWDSQFWPNGHITLNAPALVRSLKFSTWDCLGILGAFFLEQLCRHNCLPTKLTLLFIQYPIDKYKSINKFVFCNLAFMNSESFENQMSRPFEVFWRIIPTCFEWWIESLMKLLLILEIIDIKYKK